MEKLFIESEQKIYNELQFFYTILNNKTNNDMAFTHIQEGVLINESAAVRKLILLKNFEIQFSWVPKFLRFGALALAYLIREKKFNKQRFAEMLLKKHQQYGPSTLTDWRELGIFIRIDTKVARLKNLMENPEVKTTDESVIDTMRDIVGYCIFGHMIARKKL